MATDTITKQPSAKPIGAARSGKGSKKPALPTKISIKNLKSKLAPPDNAGVVVAFNRNPQSPFSDGYDLKGEEAALKDLLEMDEPDPLHPNYQRLLEYFMRSEVFNRSMSNYKARSGADTIAPDNEALRVRLTGKLVNENGAEDNILLHMRDTVFIFLGRAPSPDGGRGYIPSAKRAASCLSSLTIKTRSDNPYADWALIVQQDKMSRIDAALDEHEKHVQTTLARLAKQGFNLSLMQSAQPQKFKISLNSAYGYRLMGQLTKVDEIIRGLFTLRNKGLLTDEECKNRVDSIKAVCRDCYFTQIAWDEVLSENRLWKLSRKDFQAGADQEAIARVALVVSKLGVVPTDILHGLRQPDHTRRSQVYLPEAQAWAATLAVPAAAIEMAAKLGAIPLEQAARR